MSPRKRATIHLDSALHRALQRKSAETDLTISEIVNDAVRNALAEETGDLAAIDDRASETTRPFESFVRGLWRRGRP